MTYTVKMKVKAVRVEADSEEEAIQSAWAMVMDNVRDLVKAQAKAN